ncbi:DNA-binding protein [Halothiobacillus sp.]|uniref:DNA-binding protein n=1 Tax=Halothiobacillus sp. TaxID=1891311 RepID=UPI0026367D4C|nr:DNA-binding protein [Halothiobacillus sp.]
MTLDNLIGTQLEAVEPDRTGVERLLEAANRSLSDASLLDLSNEGRFDMAYKAVMQIANAALLANGYRTPTNRPGHHQTMIQSLPKTIGVDRDTMILLDGLRKQRNVIDYSGDTVSASMANEAFEQARLLMKQMREWLNINRKDWLR